MRIQAFSVTAGMDCLAIRAGCPSFQACPKHLALRVPSSIASLSGSFDPSPPSRAGSPSAILLFALCTNEKVIKSEYHYLPLECSDWIVAAGTTIEEPGFVTWHRCTAFLGGLPRLDRFEGRLRREVAVGPIAYLTLCLLGFLSHGLSVCLES